MFVIKKFITPFVLPPGLFITLLILAALVALIRKKRAVAILLTTISLFIWIPATAPVSNSLLRILEAPYPIPSQPHGDVIILLGGGRYAGAPDINGVGYPTGDMLGRMLTAIRLHQRLALPILISWGMNQSSHPPGAIMLRRIMIDLGIPPDSIIMENSSRDTFENARFSKKICDARGYRQPILVTSALHMPRSVFIFRKNGLDPLPFPANVQTWDNQHYTLQAYLPTARSMAITSMVLHEIWGQWYYRLVY